MTTLLFMCYLAYHTITHYFDNLGNIHFFVILGYYVESYSTGAAYPAYSPALRVAVCQVNGRYGYIQYMTSFTVSPVFSLHPFVLNHAIIE